MERGYTRGKGLTGRWVGPCVGLWTPWATSSQSGLSVQPVHCFGQREGCWSHGRNHRPEVECVLRDRGWTATLSVLYLASKECAFFLGRWGQGWLIHEGPASIRPTVRCIHCRRLWAVVKGALRLSIRWVSTTYSSSYLCFVASSHDYLEQQRSYSFS